MSSYLKLADSLIPHANVSSIDLSRIDQDVVTVHTRDGRAFVAYGFDAVEIVMATKPSSYEGLRMVWRRWDWALHNLVAHPLMQIMAWCGMGRQAVRLHDWSTPRPRGVRK